MSSKKSLAALAILLVFIASGAALLKPQSAGEDMAKAAQAFLDTLSDAERAKVVKDFGDASRIDWHFVPMPSRKGLQLREMSDDQKKAAHALLAACLSEAGYKKAATIMELEKILHAAEKKSGKGKFARDHLRYYYTIFGQPKADGRWGLSIEGHHLSLNFVVDGGKLVSHTPAFFGVNPAVVKNDHDVGPKNGTRVLAEEEQLAFKLLGSLESAQKKTAIIAEKAPADIRGPVGTQAPQEAPAGIPAAKLSESQVAILRSLLEACAAKMRSERSEADLKAIDDAGIDKVHFAWAGAEKEGIGHYYRLQGPTFLVEFVNVQPDGDGNPANHIHSVWRDLKNGDFALPAKK
jgi:hypothetical protein